MSRRFSFNRQRRIFLPSSVSYSLATEPLILAWFKADTGLVNQSSFSQWGDLVNTGGTTPTVAGLDGHLSWSIAKASGGRLISANANTPIVFGPFHIFVVGKFTGTPAAGDSIFASAQTSNNGASIRYQDGTHCRFTAQSNVAFGSTPTNYQLFNLYSHSSISRAAVNSGAYQTGMNPGNATIGGIVIGANGGGLLNKADCEVCEVIIVDGQAGATLMSALFTYLAARYPTLSLGAPPATFTTLATGSMPVGAVDGFAVGGQSQASEFSSLATAAAGAKTYVFGNDNIISGAAPAHYDLVTNQVDEVSADAIAMGGCAFGIANALAARSGNNTVIIPGPLGGSSVVAGVGTHVDDTWHPSARRGYLLRNTLLGSLIERTKDFIAKGGNFRFLYWWEGESAAASASYAQWPSRVVDTWEAFFAAINKPVRVIYTQIPVCGSYAGRGANWDAFRALQPGVAVAHKYVMISAPDGPYNADNLHVQGAGLDAIGPLVDAAAAAEGW